MQKLVLTLMVLASWFGPRISHAANTCSPDPLMRAAARSICDPLLGQFVVSIPPRPFVSIGVVTSSGEDGGIELVSGIIRVERIIDRPCTGGCTLNGALPDRVPVTISGVFLGNWLVRVDQAAPPGQENLQVSVLYRGPGDLSFNEHSYTHPGDGSTQSGTWRDLESLTVPLGIGDHPFTIGLEGRVRADGAGMDQTAVFVSTLSLTARIDGPSTFEVSCVPEPEALPMLLAGWGTGWVMRKRRRMSRG